MKITTLLFALIVLVTGCVSKTSQKDSACNCCAKAYSNLDSAANCILQTPDSTTTAEYRLFLFAFVSKDIQANQQIGWDILIDKDIIDIAKKRYLLVIQDPTAFKFLKQQMTPELNKLINNLQDKPHFVIANQSLYPFADWKSDEKKEIIIDRLEVGDGP
jgi:hypothetical protein